MTVPAMDACLRAYDAWRRTQPQDFMDFAALDEQPALPPPSRGLLVECVGTGSTPSIAGGNGGPAHSNDRRPPEVGASHGCAVAQADPAACGGAE